MMDCTKALLDQFGDASKHPAMGMLKPDLSLVGSMPEGTRAGDVVEIDVMMNLAGFKKEFLRMSQSATELVLSGEGKGFFSKCKMLRNGCI